MNDGHTAMTFLRENHTVATRLREAATLLEEQGANRFRVRAYRTAADTLEHLPTPVSHILQQRGTDGLRELPGIGVSLARSIHTLVVTGRLPMLDRLRGEMDSVALLTSIPGIGPALATRLHDDLHIHTLEQLEIAAHDGRLADIEGVGSKKLQGIIDSLTARLGRIRTQNQAGSLPPVDPPIEELLDVDREYREAAQANTLQRIAPHRFNPKREAWLPVLHTTRGTRHYTVMFSNSALAHKLKKTHDWVLLYYDDEHHGEHQRTVVTGHQPPFFNKRVVRGREPACEEYYRACDMRTAVGTPHG